MSLAITYDELRREVGRFLGYDRDPANWSADQIQDVADIFKSGLRRFYFPYTGEQLHRWTFLQPVATLNLIEGTKAYDLPDDFGGMLPCFTFAEGSAKRKVERAPEETIRTLYATNDQSGTPVYFALRVKPQDDGVRERYEAIFYPTPDADSALLYRYAIEPQELTASNSVPLGGAMHSETVLESCLAAAEKALNDEEGIHAKRFAELLAASIMLDLSI